MATHHKVITLIDQREAVVFSTGWSPFSSIHHAPFHLGGIRYNSSEQALQALKACHMQDYHSFAVIMRTKYPSRLAQMQCDWKSMTWESIVFDKMLFSTNCKV